MSSIWNNNLSVSIFGESHGAGIGVVIDKLPAGEEIDMDKVLTFMARRAPKKDGTSTMRNEKDMPEILSGLYNNKTTGTPLCVLIRNTDQHSNDYNNILTLARPGHADFTGFLRYNGSNDIRGGGHFSGRLTAPLVFAGAICEQILERRGIVCGAHIYSIHNIIDDTFDNVNVTSKQLYDIKNKYFPVINGIIGEKMIDMIKSAKEKCDSVGGIVECAVVNLPQGIGSPMFDGLENKISSLMFGIPAVKGIEFGAGFEATKLYGSENNDEFYVNDSGVICTKTNNHGGILGGISSGMPLILKVAFKPTPSISQKQNTVDYIKYVNSEITVKGRHDPCIVPRAVPCVESAVNIAILSAMLEKTEI